MSYAICVCQTSVYKSIKKTFFLSVMRVNPCESKKKKKEIYPFFFQSTQEYLFFF